MMRSCVLKLLPHELDELGGLTGARNARYPMDVAVSMTVRGIRPIALTTLDFLWLPSSDTRAYPLKQRGYTLAGMDYCYSRPIVEHC